MFSWLNLAVEFALGVLIWFKELRYPLLAIGLAFHLCLEYAASRRRKTNAIFWPLITPEI